MIFKKKPKNRIIFVTILLALVWGVYNIQALSLFSEVKELTTGNSPYIIKVLEFTNYRSEELSLILIVFFILISITEIISMYIYRSIRYTNDRKLIGYIVSINIVNLFIICIISNIFWTVYILLTILSLLIFLTSVYVSDVFFNSKTKFQKGDIIYYSGAYQTEEMARKSLKEKVRTLDKDKTSTVSGDIFKLDKEYFFEIYANDQLILDSKGEFIVHEKAK